MRMSDGSYFLKSRAQMEATFRPFIDLPASAFDNTLRIAEMCEVDLEDPTYHLPDLPIPEGYTYETYLRHLTEEGAARLYGDRADDPEVQERKEHELQIIHQMGFDIYFLIVADLCDFARRRNIWWNVRGSGAGSLVAYCRRHHRHRSAQEQPDLRALPQPGPRHHARLRPGLSRRPARRDDPLHGARSSARARSRRSSPLTA